MLPLMMPQNKKVYKAQVSFDPRDFTSGKYIIQEYNFQE